MEAQRNKVISSRLLHEPVEEPGCYFCQAGFQRIATCPTHMAGDTGPGETLRAQALVSWALQLYLIWSYEEQKLAASKADEKQTFLKLFYWKPDS